jgi:hypothetical protein
MNKVSIRCLTDGAIVLGERMRAMQVLEREVDDAEMARLRVIVAAGDIAVDGLTQTPLPVIISARSAKASE